LAGERINSLFDSSFGMKKIIAYLKLTRPQNDLIVALSVLVGALVAGEIDYWRGVIFACLSALFISAGGNCLNDFFDVKIDRINKPFRPLPRKEISTKSALWFSGFLFFVGFCLSIFIRPLIVAIAAIAIILLIFYGHTLKRKLFWGNFVVSSVSALAFVYGGITTKDFRLSLIPAIFAFFFHMGREIIKDAQDLKGDLSLNVSSLPIRFGIRFSLALTTIIFSFLILLTSLPYIFQILSLPYLIMVIPGVDLVLLYVVWSMWRDSTTSNLGRLSTILKIDMFLGLSAIYIGKF
jgi:geranylgeranylglycerol-phosphate geranylgeranyltransferase